MRSCASSRRAPARVLTLCFTPGPLYLLLVLLICLPAAARGQEDEIGPPLLIVTGRGEVQETPDQAVVRIGAQYEAAEAAAAQQQVNQAVQQTVKAIRALGVPEERIRTASLYLTPVYQRVRTAEGGPQEPTIAGYRATNTIVVTLDDISLLGQVIDAGVSTGANKIEGISFQLKDDSRQRREALQQAARDAHGKAMALAEAAGLVIGGIFRLQEGSVGIVGPEPQYSRGVMAMAEGGGQTPVQPGQMKVQASVTAQYFIQAAD
jgi:uncharacterized protein YggE